jgi:anti-sigma factor RsiW
MEYQITETCKQLIAQLSRFIDGELDPALCAKIEQHLATCPYCRIVVDTTQKTIALYHAEPDAELPARVRAHLIEILNLEAKEN